MRPAPVAPADRAGLISAVEILRAGGVIAYPTETLYGLGGLADDDRVVERVLEIKGRGPDKPLPLIVADEEMAAETVRMTGLAHDLARLFWPGPLTLILEAQKPFPQGVAPKGKVALRVSSHPVAQALARALARPLTATSANLSGQAPATLARQVRDGLGQSPPDLILEADPCPGGPSSTILDLTQSPPRILRAGAVPEEELERFIKGWA